MPMEIIKDHEKNRGFLEALYRDLTSAEHLLAKDRNFLHYRSSVGETPFHYVVIEASIPLATKLLEWGADANSQDDFGMTPLMRAVQLGNLQMVKWLVDNGVSLNVKDVQGETALSLATSNEKKDIFELLISLPRQHPIDYYYDDLTAHEALNNPGLVMRSRLIELGLTKRFT